MRTIQEDFQEFLYLDQKRAGEGVSPKEFGRWQLLCQRLEKAFAGGFGRPPGADRRQSLRLPTRLRVAYDALSGLEGTVINLSRGGCFVRTDLPAPIGTHLTLLLYVANLPELLELGGEVVSVRARPRVADPRDWGMGLRFENVPPETQKKLDDLYVSLLSFFAFESVGRGAMLAPPRGEPAGAVSPEDPEAEPA